MFVILFCMYTCACAQASTNILYFVFIQSFLRLARSSQPLMSCTMSSKAKNTGHGRRSTSLSCSSIWSSVWIYARAIWPRKVSTSTRTSASRYVWRIGTQTRWLLTIGRPESRIYLFVFSGQHQVAGGCCQSLPEAGRRQDRDCQRRVPANGSGHWGFG